MGYTSVVVVLMLIILGAGWTVSEGGPAPISKEIFVKPQAGAGHFTKIQDAIDQGVPENNKGWVLIHVAAGVYSENVTIPLQKQFVYLKGEGNTKTTVVYKSSGWTFDEAVLMVLADNFIAQQITFKNSYSVPSSNPLRDGVIPALAASVRGDKNAFYECSFVSVQDTLHDFSGHHHFRSCYIEGAVDFIFGDGTSMYQGCSINVTGYGYITAQKREKPDSESGFVFTFGHVTGTGPTYLGRAYGPYSRVVFYKTQLSRIVEPAGWDAWDFKGRESQLTYAEIACRGDGANMTQRVPWMKTLSPNEAEFLTSTSFIDKDGWLSRQPLIQNVRH